MDAKMTEKERLLNSIQSGVKVGIVTEAEVRAVLHPSLPSISLEQGEQTITPAPPDAHEKLSAVEVMFYIAGLVLFAAIMSMIVQSWETGSPFTHILLSAGVGAGLWTVAHVLHKQQVTTSLRKGLENSLVLTGSLCIIAGGFIFTNELIGGFDEVNFIPGAFTFAILGALHFAYDKLVKKDLVLMMAILLSVASFPALLFGILQGSDVPFDVWSAVCIAGALALAYAARVVVKMQPDRTNIKRSFDPLTAFLTLGTMFVSSFGDYGIIWLMLLIGAVFGLFYLSILMQNKHLLGNASFFLVVSVLTIAFKYFSGAGVTVSLVVAAFGLLGSAVIATSINKKYFKDNQQPK